MIPKYLRPAAKQESEAAKQPIGLQFAVSPTVTVDIDGAGHGKHRSEVNDSTGACGASTYAFLSVC